MASFGLILPCYAGGISFITLSFDGTRQGGNDDAGAFRCVRRISGVSDMVLPGTFYFRLGSIQDSRSWTWIDPDLPTTDDYGYVIQAIQITGYGTFGQMNLSGFHLAR